MVKQAKRKPGRPKGDTPPFEVVTFRADAATLDALKVLTDAAVRDMPGLAVMGARGVAIRKALIEAAAMVKAVRS